MGEPSMSEPSKSRRLHARGKSVDVSSLSLSMINDEGEVQPISDAPRRSQQHGRAKSMDFRGLDLEEMRDSVSLFEDGSAKALYKNSLREKAMRKGRIFQPLTPTPSTDTPRNPADEDPVVVVNPVEVAFNEETKAMEKEREQLEVDIYGLEQDIRMMKRHLEQKSKELKDANALLAARDADRECFRWEGPGDVRPRAQRFPSDTSIAASPALLSSPSPFLSSNSSVSPVLFASQSPGVCPSESPAISATSNPAFSPFSSCMSPSISPSAMSVSPLLSASSSPALPPAPTSLRHSASGLNLRIPSGTTPPLPPATNATFALPTITFPSSRASVTPVATPVSPRFSPFRHLNRER